jgi:hypothetical protein
MKCPRCQQDNPAHARFCLGYGAGEMDMRFWLEQAEAIMGALP